MKYLTRCEEEVLLAVLHENENENERLDVAMIMKAANHRFHHEWKPQTVGTFLGRLVNKEFMRVEKIGNHNYYYPITTLEQYRMEYMQRVKYLLYDNSANLLKEQVASM